MSVKSLKPESLEAKFNLMTMVPFDRRMKRKHILVYGFILDWFHSKYGDALASVRHIVAELKTRDPFGNGLFVGDVHSALSDLVEWGYLTQEKGSGRRASRYVPAWSKFDSVRETPNATGTGTSVSVPPNTSVSVFPNTTGDSVRESPNKDPSTVTRPQDGVTGIDGLECAAPAVPLASGLSAAAAATAQDGFEELWNAYDFKQRKVEARRAYAKLAPDPMQHAALVTAAHAWQASWAAQGKANAPRFTLAKWIEREEYECDPPTGFQAKAKTVSTASRPATAATARPVEVQIVNAEVVSENRTTRMELEMVPADGSASFRHSIFLEHFDGDRQYAGQCEFAKLVEALGLGEVDDTRSMKHVPFTISGGETKTYGVVYRDDREAA